MPKIVIEINDVISKEVISKIDQIDSSAKFASVSVSQLGDALSAVNAKALSGLDKSLASLVTQIDKANQAQEKLIKQSELSAKQSNALSVSVQKIAIAEEKSNQEKLKSQILQERLAQTIERGNQQLERKAQRLEKVSEAERKLAIESEKRYQQEIKSAYTLIRTPGVTERSIGKSGISESIALQTLRNSEQQASAEKKVAENIQRQLNAKVAINNLKELNSATEKANSEKKIAENIERQFRAKVAINNLRQSDTGRQALGSGGGGAVGTGSNGFFSGAPDPNAILNNNKGVERSIDLYRTFGTILRTIRLAEYAKDLAISTDTYTLINNRLALVSTSLEETKVLYGELLSIANDARAPIEDLAKSFVRFDYALKPLGASQKESLRFTETFSKQLAISGLAVQEQTSVLLQMSQALNKGKLDGDEFRTVMETLPTVATAIAETMGVARGELIALAPQGKITSDIIRQALASIAEETDERFKKSTKTIGQAFTIIGNNAVDAIGRINEATGASSAIAKSLIFLSKGFKYLGEVVAATSVFLSIRYASAIGNVIKVNALLIASNAKVAASFLANPVVLFSATATAIAVLGYEAVNYLKVTNEQNAATDALNVKLGEEEVRRRKGIKTLKESQAEMKKKLDLYNTERQVFTDTIDALKSYTDQEESILTKRSRNIELYRVSKLFDDEINKLKAFQEKNKSLTGTFNEEIIELERQKVKAIDKIKEPKEDTAKKDRQNNILKELKKDTKEYIETFKDLVDLRQAGRISQDQFNSVLEKTSAGQKKIAIEERVRVDKSIEDFDKLLLKAHELEDIDIKFINDNPELYNDVAKAVARVRDLTIKAEEEIDKKRDDYFRDRIEKEREIREESDRTAAQTLKGITDRQKREALDVLDSYKELKDIQKAAPRVVANGDPITERQDVYDRQIKQLQAFKEKELALVTQSREAIKSVNDKYRLLEKEAEKKLERDKAIIYAEATGKALGVASNAFDAFAQLAKKREGDASRSAKVLFAISKSLALGEAIIAMSVAIANANKPENLAIKGALITSAVITGAAQIATIVGTTLQGYANGGLVGGSGTGVSDSNIARVSRGEYVINAQATSRNKDLLDRINYGSSFTSNPNYTNVSQSNSAPIFNIYNNANAKVEAKPSANGNPNEYDIHIDNMEAILAKRYSEGNGKLAKAIDGKRTRGY